MAVIVEPQQPDEGRWREIEVGFGNLFDARQHEVAVVGHNGNGDGQTVCQRIGMIKRQLCWCLGIVDAERILPARAVAPHHIAALMLSVGVNGGVIGNLSPRASHRYGMVGRQKRKNGIAHLCYRHLSVLVLYWNEIGVLAYETVVTMECQIILQGAPSLEQWRTEGLALHTLHHQAVDGLAFVVIAGHNHDVTIGSTEKMRQIARLPDSFDV